MTTTNHNVDLAALQSPPPATPPTNRSLEERIGLHTEEVQTAAWAIVNDPNRSGAEVANILTSAGIEISASAILRHRNKTASL